LAASAILTFVCVLSGGLRWYLVLRGIGVRARLGESTRVHLLSSLGGYLPGYGWRFVSKGYLTRRLGVPLGMVSAGLLFEFITLAITRVVVGLSVLPREWLTHHGLAILHPYLLPARVLVWVALAAVPMLTRWAAGWLQTRRSDRWGGIEINASFIWLSLLTMALTWAVYGVGLGALLHSLHRLDLSQVPLVIFSTSASNLVSLILFVVPGGLAVREGVVIYVLEGFFPALVVTAGALLSRVSLLACELFGAFLGWLVGLRRRIM
jgi:uncharacterized membrane protein YbhN (UPF0104 family)